jgi:hypothetical protein
LSHISRPDLKLLILLPQPPKYWDDRWALPHPALRHIVHSP